MTERNLKEMSPRDFYLEKFNRDRVADNKPPISYQQLFGVKREDDPDYASMPGSETSDELVLLKTRNRVLEQRLDALAQDRCASQKPPLSTEPAAPVNIEVQNEPAANPQSVPPPPMPGEGVWKNAYHIQRILAGMGGLCLIDVGRLALFNGVKVENGLLLATYDDAEYPITPETRMWVIKGIEPFRITGEEGAK